MAAAQDYAGSAACATCHPDQARQHRESGHSRALSRIERHPLRERWPSQAAVRRGQFLVQWSWDGTTARTRTGDVVAVAEWAFGSGRKGVTFVGPWRPDQVLEHALSFYPAANAMGLSPGHERRAPAHPEAAIGQVLRAGGVNSAQACFACHTTTRSELGVGCESCHGAAARHARDGSPMAARSKPNGEQQNALCGRCHRPASQDAYQNDFRDPWNVRHQPPYLEQSRCFQESAGSLGCLTCHSPHGGLDAAAATRASRACRSCHSAPLPDPCDGNCTSCHMPEVRVTGMLVFRNHWIGVYGPSKLVPRP